MRWAKAGWVIILVLVMLTWVGACAPTDPYAHNLNGPDPRAWPLLERKGIAPSSESTLTEFKALPRPIIVRYVHFETTMSQALEGYVPYTHIVLTDAACAFIQGHTFDEMAIALFPLLHDAYWSGDVMAILTIAGGQAGNSGDDLSKSNYHSPDEQGTWPQIATKTVNNWGITGEEAKWIIDRNQLIQKTSEQLARERRNCEILRKHGLFPKRPTTR